MLEIGKPYCSGPVCPQSPGGGLCSCHAPRVGIWLQGWDAELSARISLDILDFESAICLRCFFFLRGGENENASVHTLELLGITVCGTIPPTALLCPLSHTVPITAQRNVFNHSENLSAYTCEVLSWQFLCEGKGTCSGRGELEVAKNPVEQEEHSVLGSKSRWGR